MGQHTSGMHDVASENSSANRQVEHPQRSELDGVG
jgi:hypothetical protein